MEGVFKQLFAIDHPDNNNAVAHIRKQRVGREVGDDCVQVRQFFKDGQLEVLCTSPCDCDDQIRELGLSQSQADPLNANLPYGGWRATITREDISADGKTVAAKPAATPCCSRSWKPG
jgi:hypothetical protein